MADGFKNALVVGLVPITAVDENHPRHVPFRRLLPSTNGTRANAQQRINHQNHHVGHVHRVHGFAAKIGIAGRVGDKQMPILPGTVKNSAEDTAFLILLLLAKVRHAGAIVNTATPAYHTALEQDQVRQARLARSGVTCQYHIANFFRCTIFHRLFSIGLLSN